MPSNVAALLQDVHWDTVEKSISLDAQVELRSATGTPPHDLYLQLCSKKLIDYGDPYEYPSMLLITKTDGPRVTIDLGNPYNDVNRLVNVLVIALGGTIRGVRVISSEDGFASASYTAEILAYGGQNEFLPEATTVTSDTLALAATMWRVADERWSERHYTGRLAHALAHFDHAWRAQHLYSACVNLSIALEALLAPHDQSELSHQVAFSVAWLLGRDASHREDLFRRVKRLYRVRSSLVHGAPPDDDRDIDAAQDMFALMLALFRRVLLDADLARRLDNDTERRTFLASLLFE